MGNITTDQKLTLLNQLRTQYDRNQSDLMHREQLLYGKTTVSHNDCADKWASVDGVTDEEFPVRGTLRIRLLVAVILAVLFILSDQKGKDILGVNASQIYPMIEKDYLTQMEEISREPYSPIQEH